MVSKAGSKRGRPNSTSEQIQVIRKQILDATKEVFGSSGTQGLTVKKIISSAGISRPTFYKYFPNVEEPLDLVIEQANFQLTKKMLLASQGDGDGTSKVLAAIDAYIEWGKEEFIILSSIHQELLIPDSPVSKHRINTLNTIYELLKHSAEKHPELDKRKIVSDKVIFESVFIAVENIGYHLLLNADSSKVDKYRADMLKLMIALFGNSKNWEEAAKDKFLFPDEARH